MGAVRRRVSPLPKLGAPFTTLTDVAFPRRDVGDGIPTRGHSGVNSCNALERFVCRRGGPVFITFMRPTKSARVANENDSVVDWLRIMSNDRFRRLPVVDAKGKIKVIFTQGDFVSYTWPDFIFQASQLAKASFMKGFSVNILLIMMFVYGVVLIAAMKIFL